MLFSRAAVHGIYTLCYLNRAASGTSPSSPMVAASVGIPREQASKVLQRLSRAGLVRSIRGRRGGYVLVKKLEDISVVDVLDALNPPENDERLRPKTCKRDSTTMCQAHHGFQQLNDRIRRVLGNETLAGLVGSVCSDLNSFRQEPRGELFCAT